MLQTSGKFNEKADTEEIVQKIDAGFKIVGVYGVKGK